MSSISAKQIDQLGIGLAQDRHAREIADIAVVVSAGVDREHVALLPALRGRRAVVARTGGDQAILERQPAVGFLDLERVGQSPAWSMPGPCLAITACINSITRSEAILSSSSSAGDFTARSRSSTNSASTISASGRLLLQRGGGVHRQERHLDADAFHIADLLDVLDRLLHHVDRARRRAILLRRPERLHLALEVFEPMAEERGLLRRAFRIDDDRQVAAQSHRVHVVEEERAMAAEQVLHVVLRGREQHVNAGVFHQAVEPRGVERNGRCSRLDGGEHIGAPWVLSGVDSQPDKRSRQAPPRHGWNATFT